MIQNYYNRQILIAGLFFAILFSGCNFALFKSSKTRGDSSSPAEDSSSVTAADTESDSINPNIIMFDPTELGDDGVFDKPAQEEPTPQVVPAPAPIPVEQASVDSLQSPESPPETAPIEENFEDVERWEQQERPGYRVQIFATNLDDQARDAERKASLQFPEGVYLIYDPPMYKIRVGNFVSKEEAERMRKLAKSLGYRDAWVVRDKIIAKVPIKEE